MAIIGHMPSSDLRVTIQAWPIKEKAWLDLASFHPYLGARWSCIFLVRMLQVWGYKGGDDVVVLVLVAKILI